ncbi:MAG: AMP-binding protein [Eubacteriales bacterium]|nr:AMP-binding protein [Eubacteriales bacterium]
MRFDYSKYWYEDIRPIEDITGMLRESAELYAENPAFWVKEKRGSAYEPITYKVMHHDVESLGTALVNEGFSGSNIAVCGKNCYEWIVSYLAVMTGTGTVVPIDRELSGDEIENLLETAECDVLFATDDVCRKIVKGTRLKWLYVMEAYGDRRDSSERPVSAISDPEEYRRRRNLAESMQVIPWRTLLTVGEDLLGEGDTRFIRSIPDKDAASVILFTSGTTGNPKGVMLSQRNIASNIMDVCRIAHIYTWDKTLSILPIHHTYECTLGMLLVLYRGASTAFSEGLKYISKNMKEAENTVIIGVPRVLEMVYSRIEKEVRARGKEKAFQKMLRASHRMKAAGLPGSRILFRSVRKQLGGKLRLVITGAAAMQPNVFRAFEDMGLIVLQGYGMTECTPLVSGTPMREEQARYRKAGSVGIPVKSGEVKISDPDEEGIGEILFRGPNVMLGYYKMPEETNEVLTGDGWLHTGDLGFVDPEGWIYLTGRKKNVIVTSTGENVYPEEIEDYINKSRYIEDSMVFPYKENGEEMVAVQIFPDAEEIKESMGKEPSFEETEALLKSEIQELNQGLSVYKRIRRVFVRKEDFVRTTTKKIKRQENKVSESEGERGADD